MDGESSYQEWAEGRYWGKYRGFVADRDDPEKLGRLRVRVPSLLADAQTGWAWPSVPHPGLFMLPAVGDLVWVEFAEGDLQHPIWTGCGWGRPGGTSEVPPEALGAYADTAVLRTPAGNAVILSDAKGGEKITVRSANGCEIVLDTAANRVTISAGEVVISTGGAVQELATKAFVEQTYATHRHLVTALGAPTEAPTPIPNPNALTKVLKAE
ncbi:phage baseplate assembly protein V [Solwaraspora sp. WMMB762]|uniref:phage baseplate assembly protein V n=1 Tax=Solwaraspora sp. WMMB762 TaxID=3404120 RepID=UPI003B92CF05